MRLSTITICIGLLLTSVGYAQSESAATDTATEAALPEGPIAAKAREAYNAGRFNEAGRLFKQVARQHPENPAVYRAMARAFSWAKEHSHAVVAYRQYLAMAPDAADAQKVKAELELVSKKVSPLPPNGPPSNIVQALEAIEARARAGRFTGTEGAFGALDAVLESSWVGPEIAVARRGVVEGLNRHSEEAIDRWWSANSVLEATTAADLTLAWEGLAQRLKSAKLELSGTEMAMRETIDGLAALADGQYRSAVRLLEAGSAKDFRLRFAQAIALMKLKRYREVVQLTRALSRHQAEPRILLMLGIAELNTRQNEEGIETLVEAMEAGIAQ